MSVDTNQSNTCGINVNYPKTIDNSCMNELSKSFLPTACLIIEMLTVVARSRTQHYETVCNHKRYLVTCFAIFSYVSGSAYHLIFAIPQGSHKPHHQKNNNSWHTFSTNFSQWCNHLPNISRQFCQRHGTIWTSSHRQAKQLQHEPNLAGVYSIS